MLVCQDGRRAERFGHPVLSDIGPAKPWAGGPGRLRTAVAAPLRRRFGFGPLLGFDERLRLANFLRAHAVTVALAEFGYAGVLVAEACAMAGVPLFVCFRGHDATLPARLPSLRRRYRRLFAQAEGIIAESRFIAGKVAALGCPEAKLSVLAERHGGRQLPPGRLRARAHRRHRPLRRDEGAAADGRGLRRPSPTASRRRISTWSATAC